MLEESQRKELEEINKKLESILDIREDKLSEIFIESKNGEDGTFEITANPQGLIILATGLLQLALENKEGKHLHYDKNSLLNSTDCPFIFKFTNGSQHNEHAI